MAKVKTAPLAHFKAADTDDGTFEALVSVFGNVDLGGDRVVKGAFAKSLQAWKASGDPIPVIWSHQWADPDMHIGSVTDAEERDEGLWVKGQLDLDAPVAAQVYRLLKARRVREFSFAYDVGDESKASDGANELHELDVIEVGPTLKGMNTETELLDVKAAQVKAARLKARVTLDGSYEQLLGELYEAVKGWAVDMLGDDFYAAALEATYSDRVVFYAERWSEPPGGGSYYQAPWSRGDDGIELGDAQAVTITGVVEPKAAAYLTGKKHARAARETPPAPKARYSDPASVLAELALEGDLAGLTL